MRNVKKVFLETSPSKKETFTVSKLKSSSLPKLLVVIVLLFIKSQKPETMHFCILYKLCLFWVPVDKKNNGSTDYQYSIKHSRVRFLQKKALVVLQTNKSLPTLLKYIKQ